jgi:hypothetical protein
LPNGIDLNLIGVADSRADATLVCPSCGGIARTTRKRDPDFTFCEICKNEGFRPITRSAYLAEQLRENQK